MAVLELQMQCLLINIHRFKSFKSEYADLVYTDDLFNIYKNNLYLPVGIITILILMND